MAPALSKNSALESDVEWFSRGGNLHAVAQAPPSAVDFARSLGIIADPWQAQMLTSQSKRLLLNCSRQSGKSTTASVRGLHRALFWPRSLVLLISPSLRQSGELFRKVSDLVAHVSPAPKLIEDNALSMKLANGSRIVSLPSSEATIRGFSAADLIIEDEASRVDDLIYGAMRPMLATSNGTLVLMSTPFGKRGHFFDEWTKGGDRWERIEIRGDQCKRITPEFLAEERAKGEWWFLQEYNCQFVDTTDQAFGSEYIAAAFDPNTEALSL